MVSVTHITRNFGDLFVCGCLDVWAIAEVSCNEMVEVMFISVDASVELAVVLASSGLQESTHVSEKEKEKNSAVNWQKEQWVTEKVRSTLSTAEMKQEGGWHGKDREGCNW